MRSKSWATQLKQGRPGLKTGQQQRLAAKPPSCSQLLLLLGCRDAPEETVEAAGLAFLQGVTSGSYSFVSSSISMCSTGGSAHLLG